MNSYIDLSNACDARGLDTNHVGGECFLATNAALEQRERNCSASADCGELSRRLITDAASCQGIRASANSVMSFKQSGLSADLIYQSMRNAQIPAFADELPRSHYLSGADIADLIRIAEAQPKSVGIEGFAEMIYVGCMKQTGLYSPVKVTIQ